MDESSSRVDPESPPQTAPGDPVAGQGSGRDGAGDVLATLFAGESFGLALLDAHARVAVASPAFGRITGYPLADIEGQRLTTVIRAEIDDAVAQVLAGSVPDPVECGSSGTAPDETGGYFLMLTPRAEEPGFAALVVDVTEQCRRQVRAAALAAAFDLATESLDAYPARAVALAVPKFVDFCVIDVMARAGYPRRRTVAHVDATVQAAYAGEVPPWSLETERLLNFMGDRDRLFVPSVPQDARDWFLSRSGTSTEVPEPFVNSVLVATLQGANGPNGLVVFGTLVESGRVLDPGDREFLAGLARLWSSAIESQLVQRESETARVRLEVLGRIGQLLSADLDATVRLRKIAELMVPDLADLAAVFRPFGAGLMRLVAIEGLGMDGDDQRTAVEGATPLRAGAHPPLRRAMSDGDPFGVEGLPGFVTESLPADTEIPAGFGASLVIPLLGAERSIGILVLGRQDGSGFNQDDIAFIQSVVGRIAAAVDHALLYEQDASTARTLQHSLLPRTLAHLPDVEITARYVPGVRSLSVGGDWYESITLGPDRLLVAIGDVVGHGVHAAAWMGRLRAITQLAAFDGDGPAAILRRLDRYSHVAPGSLASSAVVAVYESSTRSLTLANAGHPPPLLHRPSGAEPERLSAPRGPLLGAVREAEYEEFTVPVEADSLFVLYTDGLVERRDAPIDSGIGRVAREVVDARRPLAVVADAIVVAALRGEDASDDVALMVLRLGTSSVGFRAHMPRHARELGGLRAELTTWLQSTGADDTTIEELVFAVNELAANAIEHAGPEAADQFDVEGELVGDQITLTVVDHAQWQDSGDRPGNRGRGLALARAFSDSLVIESELGATSVRVTRVLGDKRTE